MIKSIITWIISLLIKRIPDFIRYEWHDSHQTYIKNESLKHLRFSEMVKKRSDPTQ